MKKEHAEQFNQEVDRYRTALLTAARISDWGAFKTRAGKLFDYIETVESSERERKFFSVFNAFLSVLVAVVVMLLAMDFIATTAALEVRRTCILMALAGSGFELFFFVDFRLYNEARKSDYARRRQRFILGIEQDFRSLACQNREAA